MFGSLLLGIETGLWCRTFYLQEFFQESPSSFSPEQKPGDSVIHYFESKSSLDESLENKLLNQT